MPLPPVARPTLSISAGTHSWVLAAALVFLLLAWPAQFGRGQERPDAVQRLQTIGFTVGDADREAAFFTNVLQFEKVADFRLVGAEYGKLQGVFNASMRIVQLRLGDQLVELMCGWPPPGKR